MRVMRLWKRLSGETVNDLSLGVFEARLDGALRNLF